MPLKIAILRELANAQEAGATAYPKDALRNSVRWALVPQPAYAEIDTALSSLEERGHITAVANEVYGTRYFLTDSGRAMLANK